MTRVNITIPKKKKIELTNKPEVVARFSLNPAAKRNIYNVTPYQQAGTARGATVRAPKDYRSREVRDYDAMSGREQADYVTGLTALSQRKDFKNAGALDTAIWANSTLQDIEANTSPKDPGFSWFDVGETISRPIRAAAGKIYNSLNQDSRLQDIENLYREGKITKEEATYAAQNIYNDSVDSKVEQTDDGKIKVVRKGSLEFGKGFGETGTELAVTYSPIGAGYGQVAKQGLRMAAKPLLKETLAYTGAMTGNDVLQGRGITPEGAITNAATAFGGAAIGAGIGLPQGMRAASKQAKQTKAAATMRSNLGLGNVATRNAVHIIDNAADDLARQVAEVPTPTQAAPVEKPALPGVAKEKLTLHRGANDVNTSNANPDRPVYHADTPEYASTYGDVTSKEVVGGVLNVDNAHAYDRINKHLRKSIAKHLPPEEWKKLTGQEQIEIESWVNHTLDGERLSKQFNKPMPEVVKKAFDDLGIDYIRIPGDRFKGTVGEVGHQTEIIELPKPKNTVKPKSAPQPAQPIVNEPVVPTQVEEPLLTRPQMPEQTGPTRPSAIDSPNEFMTESRIAREEARTRYDENPVVSAKNQILEQLYDPLAVAQKYDNQWFKFARDSGMMRQGQKELLSSESLTGSLSLSRNPQRVADTLMNMKYRSDIGDLSFNDIVRKYGESTGEKAQRFQDYRLFKDQLWRMENGEINTIPDSKKRMKQFVERYELENPDAMTHNAVLREHELTLDRMMEEAGLLESGTTARFAENPYYTRRGKAKPDNAPSMKIEGGMRTGVKQVSERTDMNTAPTAELSDIRKATAEVVRSTANARAGNLIKKRMDAGAPGMENFKLELDADVMRYHKQMLNETRKLKKEFDELRKVRDMVKGEKRKATAKAKTVEKQANEATRKHESAKAKETKERAERTTAREDAIVRHVDRLLEMAKRDDRQVLRDLVDTKLSREEKIAIGEALSRDFIAPEVTAKTAKEVASAKRQRISKKRLSTKLQNEVDALRSMVENSRQMVNDTKAAHREAYKEFSDTTQFVGANKNRMYYTSNGELGIIDAPGDLANAISRNNMPKDFNRFFRGLSNFQKITWTGALNPAWNVYNVALKNPTLMFFNADGLSGIRPAVWTSYIEQAVEPIYRGDRMKMFKQEMGLRGATTENAFQTRRLDRTSVDDIARRANIGTFLAGAGKHPIRTLGDLWKGLDAAVAKLPNMQRTSVEYGAYKRARGLGWSEQEALDYAAGASARVFGDFNRVSKLAQAMEPLVPYSGATQAGTRALWRTAKTRPAEAALKATVLGAGMVGMASYSIRNNQEYFEDMVEQEQEYKLDNNLVIVLPGAEKQADGSWKGIVHIPLVPDFRPTWRSIWRTVLKVDKEGTNELGLEDGGLVAGELFNQMTGDMASQVYDPRRGEENAVMGAFPGSATLNIGKTIAGVDTWDGGRLTDDYTEDLPKEEQVRSYTSDTAKTLSAISQGILSPIQIDQLFAAGGTAGDIVQKPGEGLPILGESFTKPFRPGKSDTDKKKGTDAYFERQDKLLEYAAGIGDEQLYNQVKTHFSDKTEKMDDDLLKNAKTTSQYFSISDGKFRTTPFWDAMKMNEMLRRQDGEDANPIFDLEDEQLKRVLVYRSSRMLNAGKQSYDRDGNSLYVSLGLDEKWYDEFRDKESAYYDAIEKKIKKELDAETDPEKKKELQKSYDKYNDNDPKTFSGAKKPELTKEQDKLMDYYYTLPKGTGDRSAFIDSHPWVLDYWDAMSGFNAQERAVLGLKNWDELENGGSGSGGSSSSSSSGSSSSSRKARSKSRSSSSGSSSEKTLNPNQYAINPLAGGQIASPTVRRPAKGKAVKAYAPRGKAAAPEMTVKKSKV